MHAVVAMSGGVDSSVAAHLLKVGGHDVTGVIMKIWDPDLAVASSFSSACFGPDEDQDVEDARRVCKKLSIPLHVVDCASEFRDLVLREFRTEYERGRTPNPCVFCNRHMKFDLIQHKLLQFGTNFDVFATGHYARVGRDDSGRPTLLRARDLAKDQSYFLYRLSRDHLERTAFPLGDMTKPEVRAIAEDAGLPVSRKQESQDFFSGDYRDLLTALKVNTAAGRVVDTNGTVLGTHDGVHHFTIGQRKGLGVCSTTPLYVTQINAQNNEIVVGTKAEGLKSGLVASSLNMFSDTLPDRMLAKIRSTHPAISCTGRLDGSIFTLEFDSPQQGVTPGQSVVLYDDDTVIGGGVIERAL